MKAMALNKQSPIKKRPLSLTELPIPKPADNQILGGNRDVLFLFGKLIGSSLKSKFLVLSAAGGLVLSLLFRNLVIAREKETRYYYHYDALGFTIALL